MALCFLFLGLATLADCWLGVSEDNKEGKGSQFYHVCSFTVLLLYQSLFFCDGKDGSGEAASRKRQCCGVPEELPL